ncbi:MAG TPA: hypothetical protein VGG64_19475 [Pirellulales bacterium]|jgi:integrase
MTTLPTEWHVHPRSVHENGRRRYIQGRCPTCSCPRHAPVEHMRVGDAPLWLGRVPTNDGYKFQQFGRAPKRNAERASNGQPFPLIEVPGGLAISNQAGGLATLRQIELHLKAKGISRRALADRIGIAYQSLANLIYGGKPSARIRRAVFELLLELHSLPPQPLPEPPQDSRRPVAGGSTLALGPFEIPEPSGIGMAEYLPDYLLMRPMSRQSAVAMAKAIESYGKFLGRPATVGDLRAKLVNRWLAVLESDGRHGQWSVRGHRQRLVALWNAAYREDPPLVEELPLRVRPIKRPDVAPEAWTREQMQALLAQADTLQGVFRCSRVSRCDYWRAYLLVSYDTGLRLGDMMRVTFADLRAGKFVVTQGKTQKPLVKQASAAASTAVAAIEHPQRERVFGGVICRQAFFEHFKRLAEAAGLKGTSRWIRRTSGTLVEAASPGDGHKHLGNGADVFEKHYLDQRMLPSQFPLPPALVEDPTGADDHAAQAAACGGSPLLVDLVSDRLRRDVFCRKHVAATRRSMELYGEFLGYPATVADLTAASLNRWISNLLNSGAAQLTVRGHRNHLVATWNDAYWRRVPGVSAPAARVKSISEKSRRQLVLTQGGAA